MVKLPVYRTLRNGTMVELDQMHPQEEDAVQALLNGIIHEGQTYPHKSPLSKDEFAAYWMAGDAFVIRNFSLQSTVSTAKVVAAFFIKPNFPGRCSHICNAGFVVHPTMRRQGIGRFMGEALPELARDRGYSAIMFNLVFATNIASINLWKSLKFSVIGRIPNAAHLDDGRTIDALIFYRSLTEIE